MDKFFFNPVSGGMYLLSVHGNSIPESAVPITKEQRQSIISLQEQGKKFTFSLEDGIKEVVTNNQAHPKEVIEKLRRIAYSDPITGSDRYLMEMISLQAEGFAASSLEVKELKKLHISCKEAIKNSLPYPQE